MDNNWLIVLSGIISMLLVILLGMLVRKKNILSDETATKVSHFVVDYCMPAMVLTFMLSNVTRESMKTDWYLPLLGAVLILFGFLVGYLLSLAFRVKEKSTHTFLAGMGNWVYLPLPIAIALYGEAGGRVVLLFNVGAQVMLWSVGVAIIKRERPSLKTFAELGKNNGLIATIFGIALACFWSITPILKTNFAELSIPFMAIRTVYTSLDMLGMLTIPLTLVVSGAQIGALNVSISRYLRPIIEIVSAKLLIVPLFGACAFYLLTSFCGIHIDHMVMMLSILILSMPTAVSCSLFAERFGGNSIIAALAILYTTLLSCVSVPFIFYLAEHVPFK